MIAFPAYFKSVFRRRSALMVGLLSIAAVSASACAVQESNTYPVETFSEMHYSQSFKSQEPPRLAPPADSVVFSSAGDPDQVLVVPDKQERAYDPVVAGNLFLVNCSVCHGIGGHGDHRSHRQLHHLPPRRKGDYSQRLRRKDKEELGLSFSGIATLRRRFPHFNANQIDSLTQFTPFSHCILRRP